MIVELMENYRVRLNPDDINNLVEGKRVTFWIIEGDREITFALVKV